MDDNVLNRPPDDVSWAVVPVPHVEQRLVSVGITVGGEANLGYGGDGQDNDGEDSGRSYGDVGETSGRN